MNDDSHTLAPEAPPEPLFTLELGENGGTIAPTSIPDLIAWIQHEQQFWAWIVARPHGASIEQFDAGRRKLGEAISCLTEAQQLIQTDPARFKERVTTARTHLETAFVNFRLPLSTTPLAIRIDRYRQTNGDKAASFFVTAHFPPSPGSRYDAPNEFAGWQGLFEGLIDRFELPISTQEGRLEAAEASFEQLRAKAENLVGEKETVLAALHREYSGIVQAVRGTSTEQQQAFSDAQDDRNSQFDSLVKEHSAEMEQLRKTFREEMALRAPAEYWATKRTTSWVVASVAGLISFASIGLSAKYLANEFHTLLANTTSGELSEWRLGTLILIGVFIVWAIRLIVRVFLSNLHLATDAGERVVMVKTYLSLLEGNRLSEKEDRHLILQALFRPTADGIVKDEGLPPSWFEYLTRQPRS